jgi:hypothetical protein
VQQVRAEAREERIAQPSKLQPLFCRPYTKLDILNVTKGIHLFTKVGNLVGIKCKKTHYFVVVVVQGSTLCWDDARQTSITREEKKKRGNLF